MRKSNRPIWLSGVALGVILAATACTQNSESAADTSAQSAESIAPVAVADYVNNFRLIDDSGFSHELFYYSDVPATVIVAQCNECAASNNAMQSLSAIYANYADDEVQFYGLNSVPGDTRDAVHAQSEAQNWTFPVLMDVTQLVGDQIGVSRAGEVFILDPAQGFKMVYHGDAENAEAVLNDMVAGAPVSIASSQTSGSPLHFSAREMDSPFQTVSYADDVAPLLIENCVECHQPGGIGPWAMTDYDTIFGWSPMIREVLMTRRMPPWTIDETIREVEHSRALSTEDYQTIIHWIDSGSPRGEGEDPLPDVEFEVADWPLGEPDLMLTLEPFDIPATGVVDYQYPVAANPLTEDHWLRATTIRVGSRDTVHHALTGYMSEMPPPGAESFGRWEFSTGTYAAGEESMIHPDNSGVPFPAGGAIGFQMHYTPNGREVTDVTQVGFYFHDEQPDLLTRSYVIVDPTITIPPGEARHEEVAYVEFPADAELLGVFPHAHYRAISMNLELVRANGESEMVVNMPRYDFNWQFDYRLSEPIILHAGDRLIARYIYDNSERNFANPDPDSTITWGDQSFEEMMYTRLTYRWVGETTDNQHTETQETLESGLLFGALDDNFDGLVEASEMNRGRFSQMAGALVNRLDTDGDSALNRDEFSTATQMMRRQFRDDAPASNATGGSD